MASIGISLSKCVLVTGASSGIGRALATSIKALPSKPTVIGTGRRADRLEELKNAGIEPFQLELDSDKESLKRSVDQILEKYPEIDTIILNAGMQRQYDFKKGVDLDSIYSEINVNYLSVVSMISLFLPHLLKLSETRPCFIIPVTSGLGIIPRQPHLLNYSASKAALHSFTESLRIQLQDTNVKVLEIIPPLVESELHDFEGTTEFLSKFWMPLDKFTKATIDGLLAGDLHITCGPSTEDFELYEKPKHKALQA